MRNIAFLIIMIVTVAVAVSCNVNNSADSKGGDQPVSKKQEKSSVENPKVITKLVEKDNSDVLSRLDNLEEKIKESISGIALNVDNTEVLKKLDDIQTGFNTQIADINSKMAADTQKRKEQFYQILGALCAAVVSIFVVLLLTYRYLKKFIMESMIINSYKSSQKPAQATASVKESTENFEEAAPEVTTGELDEKIKNADFLFDPESSVKLTTHQKITLSDITKDIAALSKDSAEVTTEMKYLTALEKVNDKNYTDAGKILDELKKEEEPFAQAFFLSGYIAYVTRKYDTAMDNMKKACELAPDNAAYLISYGNACLKEKNFEEAATVLKKAVDVKPDDAAAWNNLAQTYIVSDKLDDAIEAFKKATALKPDFHEAQHNLGLALGKMQRFEEAADAFSKAIEAKSDKHESMYNAACVYSLLGKREGALSNLRKAIELKPEYAEKARKDKDFESFKDDEEFKTIVK